MSDNPLQATHLLANEYGGVTHAVLLYWTPYGEDQRITWVDFRVLEAESWDDRAGKQPNWLLHDSGVSPASSDDSTKDPAEAIPLVEGFVKWDGCTQFTFKDLLHYDSAASLARLFAVIQQARALCGEAMGDSWNE